MDKKQAQEIISDVFENPFDKGRFTDFVTNLLNSIEEDSFDYKGNYIPDAYKQYVSSWQRLGKYNDGENRIDVFFLKGNNNPLP